MSFYTACPECNSSFIYDIGYDVWECHDCLNHWSQRSSSNKAISPEREEQFYKDWIELREDSLDERGEKLCYCGHTSKCSCADPNATMFHEAVKRGTIIPYDPNNGWTKNKED